MSPSASNKLVKINQFKDKTIKKWGSKFLSYKMTLHFELLTGLCKTLNSSLSLTRRLNFYFSTFELLTQSWKIKVSLRVTNSMVKLLFFHFWVTNLNLKNVKLHFELLSQYRMISEIRFYLWLVQRKVYQEKTSLFFWSPSKLNYLYIIIGYCSQSLFSKLNLIHCISY